MEVEMKRARHGILADDPIDFLRFACKVARRWRAAIDADVAEESCLDGDAIRTREIH